MCGALVLLDRCNALTVRGTTLGSYAVDSTTPLALVTDLTVCSGCAALVAALVSIGGFLSGFFLLWLAALCVCSRMALLTVLTTADLVLFKTFAYLGQHVPEGFRACCYF